MYQKAKNGRSSDLEQTQKQLSDIKRRILECRRINTSTVRVIYPNQCLPGWYSIRSKEIYKKIDKEGHLLIIEKTAFTGSGPA